MSKKSLNFSSIVVLAILITACSVPAVSTPTPTSAPPQTPTPPPTPDPLNSTVTQWSSLSPDGQFVALAIFSTPLQGDQAGQTYANLSIGKPNGRIYWTLFDGWLGEGLGYTTPQPLQWSADSRYFYYTDQPVVEGCKALPVNGSNLLQVDIETGEIRELLPKIAFYLALSPDESRLAYIAQGSLNLVFRDLGTGIENTVDLNPGWEFDAGDLFWSPDGKSLALTLANKPCPNFHLDAAPYTDTTSILVVDTAAFTVHTLIGADAERKVTSGWNINDQIELRDPAGNLSFLDVATGIVTSTGTELYPTMDWAGWTPSPGEIVASDSGKTLDFVLTSRFSIVLKETDYPEVNLKEDCVSGKILGRVFNTEGAPPDYYLTGYEASGIGHCIIQNGSFEVTINITEHP